MIQRIQSIFLIIIAGLMIATLFFPFWEKEIPEKSEVIVMDAYQISHKKISTETGLQEPITTDNVYYLILFAITAAGIALYSMFRYDNRLLQMKLGAFNSLIMTAYLGIIIFLSKRAEGFAEETIQGKYKVALFLIVFALIFNIISNKLIRRDENLVRSADRIR